MPSLQHGGGESLDSELTLCPPPLPDSVSPPPGPTSVSPPSSAGLVCAWPTFKAAAFGWEIRQWEP